MRATSQSPMIWLLITASSPAMKVFTAMPASSSVGTLMRPPELASSITSSTTANAPTKPNSGTTKVAPPMSLTMSCRRMVALP